jgi:hypothetical protein
MRKFKVLVRHVTEVPFAEIEIEAGNEFDAESIALGRALGGDLGERQVRLTTDHFAIDIRDA